MGRKRTMNRMAMRTDYDGEGEERAEEEEEGAEDEDEEGDGDEEEGAEGEEEGAEGAESAGGDDEEEVIVKPKKKKKVAVKAPAKPRARTTKQVRVKVVWGVFSNSNQQLAIFPYPQEAEARADAERRTADKKTNHFVQRLKVTMDEK